MTVGEVKTELQKVRQARKAYRLAKDRADDFEQTIMCGKAVRYGGSGESHERRGNPVENAYCSLVDYRTEADALLKEMIGARKRVEKLIASIPDLTQKEVLTRRYIIGEKWEEIAEKMNYSRRRITQLHGLALKSISLNFPF